MKNITLLACLVLLSGCLAQEWRVDYQNVVTARQTQSWRVANIAVQVPTALTVSEAESYAPDADIVWRGEPLGNRYIQVKHIFERAAKRGVDGLNGNRPVQLNIIVQQFHGITDRARQKLTVSGVHNIQFLVQIVDPQSGEGLTPFDLVQADLEAFVGQQAAEAESRGITQKLRITNHLSEVIAAWVGTGPDKRRSFNRIGR